MKFRIGCLLLALIIGACSEEKKYDMSVSGEVRGLKKGTLYLQTLADSTLVTMDSIQIKGDGQFEFTSAIDGPDIFFLYLDKADQNSLNDRIIFFGEPGEITIETEWDLFEQKARILGSESQVKLEEYRQNVTRFNTRALELAQQRNQRIQVSDTTGRDSLIRLENSNLMRSFLYSLNFAINNGDSYVAPYIAVNDVSDASPKYLDSIYNNLSEEVANSKYGIKLKELREAVKDSL